MALKKFATGIYCIWYPILKEQYHLDLLAELKKISSPTFLRVEFSNNQLGLRMKGSGLWIINPPYILVQELEEILPILCDIFNNQACSYLIACD